MKLVITMTIEEKSAKIIADEYRKANKMKEYVHELEEQAREHPEQAKRDAIRALKETGVID